MHLSEQFQLRTIVEEIYGTCYWDLVEPKLAGWD
jgi:hypothetical protein